jgi:hypothetical protein
MEETEPENRVDRAWAEVDPQVLEDPTIAAVHAYWDNKREGRLMPSRADINPVEMREHLGWIMMIEVPADMEDFRYRLIGTKVARYFVHNSTGMTVSEAFAPYGPGAVKGVQAVYRKAARERVPVRAHGKANWLTNQQTSEQGHPHFDSLYLPLSDDGQTCNMLMAVFTFDYALVLEKCEDVLG